MTILERMKKQEEFVEKTAVILNRLLNWQLNWVVTHQKPSKEIIEKEWWTFFDLVEKGKKDGIADGYFFYEQGRTVIEAFKFFEDVVPEFRQLK